MVVVTSLGPPEEGIRHVQAGTTTFINKKPLGKGTLYISESRVSWVGDAGHTFSLEYPHIAMHAISRDVTAFPNAECLYLMIDVRLVDSDGTPTPSSTPESSDAEEEDDDADSGQGMTEIRYVPDDKSKLEEMFTAMSQCQALHPDEDQQSGEEAEDEDPDDNWVPPDGDGGDGEYEEEEEGVEDDLDSQGHEVQNDYVEGMFEDAEEDLPHPTDSAPHRGPEPMDE